MRKFVFIEKLPSGNYSVRHWQGTKFAREWFSDYGTAKHRAADLTLKLDALRQGLPDPTIRPIDIYNKYIESIQETHRASTIDLKNDHARMFFSDSQHINEKRIKEYKAILLKRLSVSTVSIKLREIRSVCNWAYGEGLLQEKVFSNVEIPAAAEGGRRLELDVIKKIWDNSDPSFQIFLSFLTFTGARYSEVILMKWSHLDLIKGTWFIPAANCKTNTERYVPLDPKQLTLLKYVPRSGEFVFQGWVKNTGRWYLKKACKKAGLPEEQWPTPHTFRHTFASFWEGDIRDLMDMCGWTTMLMPKRYTHRNTEDLRKAAAQKGIAASLSSFETKTQPQ